MKLFVRERERERERETRTRTTARLNMVALASLCAGGATGQLHLPTFDTLNTYGAPDWPLAIAVTPAGFDLVGATDLTPDGYPEIAVAGDTTGTVRFYRNTSILNANSPDKEITLLPLFIDDIQIYIPDVMTPAQTLDAKIRDIALANIADIDDDPDLLVAISYEDDDSFTRGKLAHFKAQNTGLTLSYVFVSVVDFDYPPTGLTVNDFTQDGHLDVLVAFEHSGESPGSPNRIAAVRNDPDPMTGEYGTLVHESDYIPPMTAELSTGNIISGNFTEVQSGGLGGGGSGSLLDFISFGGNNYSNTLDDGLILGRGTGVGQFGFSLSVKDAQCGTNRFGLATGYANSQTAALVVFDPFTNQNQSIAANTSLNQVRLIHNKPRSGAFFHLCDGNFTTDTYDMTPGTGLPSLAQNDSHLAKGKLNADTKDDIVFINPEDMYVAFMLGNGAPDANNRIMEFDRANTTDYYRFNYAPVGGTDFDRVICADLNVDGFDDVIITRHTAWTVGSWRIVVLTNTITLP